MIRLPKIPNHQPATQAEECSLYDTVLRMPERVQTWLAVALDAGTGLRVLRYRGGDLDEARRLAGLDGVVLDGGQVWPTPESAEACRCNGDIQAQVKCPWGHPNECHYPLSCSDADCGWINSRAAGDADPLVEDVRIDPTDRQFFDSPREGSHACLCSRCGDRIDEDAVRIRGLGSETGVEWRYHQKCLQGVRENESR